MKIIMVIVLLSLCFNVFPEGQMEEEQTGERLFKVIYKQSLDGRVTIYIFRCKITNDLFMMTLVFSGGVAIDIQKLDSKYSEFIEEK